MGGVGHAGYFTVQLPVPLTLPQPFVQSADAKLDVPCWLQEMDPPCVVLSTGGHWPDPPSETVYTVPSAHFTLVVPRGRGSSRSFKTMQLPCAPRAPQPSTVADAKPLTELKQLALYSAASSPVNIKQTPSDEPVDK